ncbi:MAG: hypothetical protein B6227_02410 [Fusobacteriia bacterium 4572_74]|nr:MAG: hypothetical protein B6227_02410 [Fusobacteriia bacterium 4572_74]
MGNIVIKHSLDDNKFLVMDGDIEAGYLVYSLKDNTIYILTIFVDPKYRNRSLAKRLLDECVDYIRKEEFKTVPICSYAARVFEKSNKYDDIKTI